MLQPQIQKDTRVVSNCNKLLYQRSINIIRQVLDFELKWSWGILDRLKMLPLSPLRFSTIGKPILRTFEILTIFIFFDNRVHLEGFSLGFFHRRVVDFPAKKWSRSEVDKKSQNFESSQNGLAYSGKS